MDLFKIIDPDFLTTLNIESKKKLAQQIRSFIINSVLKTGGHLSSNLGTIELTIALYSVFNIKKDKVLWDVGHQTYTHKILTGRINGFTTLRQLNGLNGFLSRFESKYDLFESGHASNSLSIATGFAIARDLFKTKHEIITVIGDAALQGGVALEALNNLGDLNTKIIIILNDNEMSISKSVGVISEQLKSSNLTNFITKTEQFFLGESISWKLNDFQRNLKNKLTNPTIFNAFNIKYIGPINGHNISEMELAFKQAKTTTKSVVIHVKTIKGKGHLKAEDDQNGQFHGVKSIKKSNQVVLKNTNSWSQFISNQLQIYFALEKDAIMISPAMILGSKLNNLFEKYPDRTFDVGICEQHALTFAAGLALAGKKPIVAIYSTFLQRAYDQLNQDIARQKINVSLIIDRCGLVGEDGSSHHGLFDVGLFTMTPGTVLATPSNCENGANLNYTLLKHNGLTGLRIYREKLIVNLEAKKPKILSIGKWEIAYQPQIIKKIIITYGPLIHQLIEKIKVQNLPFLVVNALFIKPYDHNLLAKLLNYQKPVYLVEQTNLNNSLYSYIATTSKLNLNKVISLHLPNQFIGHGSITDLYKKYQLDVLSIIEKICHSK